MTAATATPRPAVAAFDVDGTLTVRDCVTPFLREIAGARLARALLLHPLAVAAALARRDNDRLKALACRSLRGLDAVAVDARGEAFARGVRATWMRPDTLARLDRHRELGHVVVLVSASLEAYLRPLGSLLGVDDVLCTRLETGLDGRLTGRLDGPNCRAEEKVRRLDAWLAERGLADAELWAYGDSAGDRELLTRADHPTHVHGRTVGREPERACPSGALG